MGSGGSNGSGANGSNGSSRSLPTFDDDEVEQTPPPENVVELAASCVRFVASRYNVALDFTPDTLPVVDQYIRDARKELDARPESVPLLTASIGAYLGEVMRQRFGAFWFSSGDYSAWRLYFTRVYLACNPLGMMLEALAPEEAEGWHAHFEIDPGDSDVVSSRLAVFPEVDADIFRSHRRGSKRSPSSSKRSARTWSRTAWATFASVRTTTNSETHRHQLPPSAAITPPCVGTNPGVSVRLGDAFFSGTMLRAIHTSSHVRSAAPPPPNTKARGPRRDRVELEPLLEREAEESTDDERRARERRPREEADDGRDEAAVHRVNDGSGEARRDEADYAEHRIDRRRGRHRRDHEERLGQRRGDVGCGDQLAVAFAVAEHRNVARRACP